MYRTMIVRTLTLGLLILTASRTSLQAAQDVLPDSRLGIRTAPLLLLSRPDVQADLKLSVEQVGEATKAIADLHTKAAGLRGVKGEKAIAARREIDEQQRTWIETRLSEEQRKRLLQIDLQWEGMPAIVSRSALGSFLELTPEQHTQLGQVVAVHNQRRSAGEPLQTLERETTTKMLAVLTETQRQRWKAMLGVPFQPRLADAASADQVTK